MAAKKPAKIVSKKTKDLAPKKADTVKGGRPRYPGRDD
jgi:hypothetical protein